MPTRWRDPPQLTPLPADAIEDFERHEIRETNGVDRWTLMRREDGKWNSNLWCEVAVLARCTLVVHGDIDTCVFAGFSGGDARATVGWIGGSHDLRYRQEKAARGMDDSEGITKAHVAEVLHAALLQLRSDYEETHGEAPTEEVAEALDDAIERASDARDDDCDEIVRELMDAEVIDCEYASSMGYATTRRVIRAYAATMRLHELLCAADTVTP